MVRCAQCGMERGYLQFREERIYRNFAKVTCQILDNRLSVFNPEKPMNSGDAE